jgi:hypothetical protein
LFVRRAVPSRSLSGCGVVVALSLSVSWARENLTAAPALRLIPGHWKLYVFELAVSGGAAHRPNVRRSFCCHSFSLCGCVAKINDRAGRTARSADCF